MKKQIIIILLAFMQIPFAMAKDGVSFVASAPKAVVKGQQLQLTYSMNSADVKNFRMPEVKGLDVLMGPSTSTSRSYSFINGKSTKVISTTYTYVLMANKEGTFILNEASAKISGRNYKSNKLTIKVLPPDKGSAATQNSRSEGTVSSGQGVSSKNLFVRMLVSNRKVYEQEPFLVTCKLYSRVSVNGLQDVKFPEYEGFLSHEIKLPNEKQWSIENYKGLNYRTVVLKQTLLFPQRSGDLMIDKGKVTVVVQVPNQRQGRRSVFDDFFDSHTNVQKTLVTNPIKIHVQSLPANKPASFTGTVGKLKMDATVNVTELKENESLTLKLVLSGSGNMKLIKSPTIKFPADFEVYDPKIDNNFVATAYNVRGKKSFEYLAIPRHAGDFTIPPIDFTYFDVDSKTYKTITSKAYDIHVNAGEKSEQTGIVAANFSNKEEVKYLGKDIRYIYVGKLSLKKKGNLFFNNLNYWLFYIIPLIIVICLLLIYRKQARENANLALMKNKKANKVAAKRLKMANKFMKSNDKNRFYEELERALWGYVSDKMNIPLSLLSKENIGVELLTFGADQLLVDELTDIINVCEFARYAPVAKDDAMETLYKHANKVINKMEGIIKR